MGFLIIALYYGLISEDEKKQKSTVCWLGAIGAFEDKAWVGIDRRLVFFICDKRKKTTTKQGKWDDSRGQVLSLSEFFFNVLEG